jgi:hypothetical protein
MAWTWWSPQLASQVSRLKPTGLLCMGMDERTGLQCEGGKARCIAWSHFGWGRLHQKQSAVDATSNSRSSQPSSSLCCSRWWHFWKPALNTDQYIWKVISLSYSVKMFQIFSTITVARYLFVYFTLNAIFFEPNSHLFWKTDDDEEPNKNCIC